MRCTGEAGRGASQNEGGLTDAMTTDEFVSVAGAARVVGRSRQALYAHIAAGRLPATRHGGRLQVNRRDLVAFFADLPPQRPPGPSTPVLDEESDTDVVTVAEACSYLGGVRPRFIYRLVAQGKLASRREGQSLRIEVRSLEALVEASRLGPGQLRHLYPPAPPPAPSVRAATGRSSATGPTTPRQ